MGLKFISVNRRTTVYGRCLGVQTQPTTLYAPAAEWWAHIGFRARAVRCAQSPQWARLRSSVAGVRANRTVRTGPKYCQTGLFLFLFLFLLLFLPLCPAP